MEARFQRFALNEASLREVNEAIMRGAWPGQADDVRCFRCECAHDDCNLLIELTLREYEDVRVNPRRFMCYPGHEFLDVETVVATRAGYVLIEKDGRGAELVEEADARETDPTRRPQQS